MDKIDTYTEEETKVLLEFYRNHLVGKRFGERPMLVKEIVFEKLKSGRFKIDVKSVQKGLQGYDVFLDIKYFTEKYELESPRSVIDNQL